MQFLWAGPFGVLLITVFVAWCCAAVPQGGSFDEEEAWGFLSFVIYVYATAVLLVLTCRNVTVNRTKHAVSSVKQLPSCTATAVSPKTS